MAQGGGSSSRTRYDANRFQKKYPIKKITANSILVLDKAIEIETAKVQLNNESTVTIEFQRGFSGVPAAIVALHTSDPGLSHANVHVESITRTRAVVKASAPVYGVVVLQAIYLEP